VPKKIANILILTALFSGALEGQALSQEKFFQVSGIITDEDNRALTNVGVVSMKLKRGALSEGTGIYSIISTPGDTILFKALGFKKKFVILPRVYEDKRFNLDVVLHPDTIPIENVVIIPWKTYSEFIKDMTKETPVPPEIENMNRNIESVSAAVSNSVGVQISPEAGYRYAMNENFDLKAVGHQYPANNLLNPFAWAKFINGVKHGLFKNQHFDKPPKSKIKVRNKKKKEREKI
jgi:hypothetical protein